MKKVCVLGLGYIGLPTAVLLATNGYQVAGVDVDQAVLEKLSAGKVHINEPELDVFFRRSIEAGKLTFHSVPQQADAFIVAVPTPFRSDKTCDLSLVRGAVKSILACLSPGNLIIIESTVPPYTLRDHIKPLLEDAGYTVGKDVFLAFCPERVLPGNIIAELLNNARIIGGYTPHCAAMAAQYYRDVVKGKIILTDAATAEMTKLAENACRDVNIALANELTQICHDLKINVLDVIKLANEHPRVNFLSPGPGVGGHCLAVDPYFIIEKSPALANLISQARRINSSMPHYIAAKVKEILGETRDARIAVFGVSYKGNVSDLRESPALEIIQILMSEGMSIAIYDPLVNLDNDREDLKRAVNNADMILILADHDQFKSLDYDMLAKEMRTPLVFDTRNILNPREYATSEVMIYNLGNVYEIARRK